MFGRNRFSFIFVDTFSNIDTDFTLVDDLDDTKQAAFEVGGLTTGTTRTYTFPDKDGTFAMTSDISAAGSLSGLSDVNLGTLTDGEFLTYDSASSKWINSSPTFSTTLGSLTDVTLGTLSDGEVLTYDTTTSKWINATPTGGSGGEFTRDSNGNIFSSLAGTSLTSGTANFLAGDYAGASITTLSGAVAIGDHALSSVAIDSVGTLNRNKHVAIGCNAARYHTYDAALPSVIIGCNAGGGSSLITRVDASVVIGGDAGSLQNSTIYHSVFIGWGAGQYGNASDDHNIFIGNGAGKRTSAPSSSNTYNLAIGSSTFTSFNGASYNVVLGSDSGRSITSGDGNTYTGYESGESTSTGSYNCCYGYEAGDVITTGTNNTIIGATANVTTNSLTNAIALGYGASVNASNKIALGNSSVTALSIAGTDAVGGTLTFDDGVNYRVTMTFKAGILTAVTTAASTSATATWA